MGERAYFSRGCRGHVVRMLQHGLVQAGVAPKALAKFVDGDFGGKTEEGVKALQAQRGVAATGAVDGTTWTHTTQLPVPTLFNRVLQLTADFEGHGFTLAKGNFDGAGVTWGVIGFTLQGGELGRLVHEIDQRQPGTVAAAFGDLANEWQQVLAQPWPQQLAWADGITVSKKTGQLSPPWAAAFERLGSLPLMQELQCTSAQKRYYEPALASAVKLGLETERGVALCFDTHVQNGGVRDAVKTAAQNLPAGLPEAQRLVRLADAIADATSKVQYREDVRSRRRCIATGSGMVHGARYTVAAWGIDLVNTVATQEQ